MMSKKAPAENHQRATTKARPGQRRAILGPSKKSPQVVKLGRFVAWWSYVLNLGAGVISPANRTQPTTRHCCP